MTRRLATIRQIAALSPIAGADRIQAATVDGWQVVVKNGEFAVGDRCVFFEIDSFLPADDPRFSFLGTPTTFLGASGYRLRTLKLRGQLSQGLALPLGDFPEAAAIPPDDVDTADLTATLRVIKYDTALLDTEEAEASTTEGGVKRPPAASGTSTSSRTFPPDIPRTDQERVQNVWRKDVAAAPQDVYEVTVKMDGTSMTVYSRAGGRVGVCSRNQDLGVDGANGDPSAKLYVEAVKATRLFDVLPREFAGRELAVQGEVMGPKIQGNRESLPERRFFVFSVYDIAARRFFTPTERAAFFAQLDSACRAAGAGETLQHVPVLHRHVRVCDFVRLTAAARTKSKGQRVRPAVTASGGGGEEVELAELLAAAEGPSLHHAVREGVVFKGEDGTERSFKVISNTYLLREK